MGRPTTMRANNSQIEICGFYIPEKKKCGITSGGELICNRKHCTLCKTGKTIKTELKKYGWPFKEPIGGRV